MAKYSSEEKIQAALRYINGAESLYTIARSIGTDDKSILNWVRQYEYHGVKAFEKRYTNYSIQFKLDVLNYMIEQGTSFLETAAIFKIPTPSTVRSWKRKFETQGLDALQSKKKGRPSMKKEVKKHQKQVGIECSPEALQARIKQLEMENEYLKKLNALVKAKEKSPKKTK